MVGRFGYQHHRDHLCNVRLHYQDEPLNGRVDVNTYLVGVVDDCRSLTMPIAGIFFAI